jgi:hypothetical protein
MAGFLPGYPKGKPPSTPRVISPSYDPYADEGEIMEAGARLTRDRLRKQKETPPPK